MSVPLEKYDSINGSNLPSWFNLWRSLRSWCTILDSFYSYFSPSDYKAWGCYNFFSVLTLVSSLQAALNSCFLILKDCSSLLTCEPRGSDIFYVESADRSNTRFSSYLVIISGLHLPKFHIHFVIIKCIMKKLIFEAL